MGRQKARPDPIYQDPIGIISGEFNIYSYPDNPVKYIDPTGLFELPNIECQDESNFAKYFWNRMVDGTVRDGLFGAVYNGKAFSKGLLATELGFLNSRAGWAASKLPGGKLIGSYMMADGASGMAGGVCEMSKAMYGPQTSCGVLDDHLGKAYENAGKLYFGDENYGKLARGVMGMGTTASSYFLRTGSPYTEVSSGRFGVFQIQQNEQAWRFMHGSDFFGDAVSTGTALDQMNDARKDIGGKK